MRVLEYGREHEKTLLFLPCTAEPEWTFTNSVTRLAQNYHVMQIVYDGHGETEEEFDSVEATVDEVTDWRRVLKKGGVFVLHDSMKPQMYGDMIAFVEKLDGI